MAQLKQSSPHYIIIISQNNIVINNSTYKQRFKLFCKFVAHVETAKQRAIPTHTEKEKKNAEKLETMPQNKHATPSLTV